MDDPYFKLRPEPPTPEDELCACQPPRVWKLMWALGSNPVHCTRCNLEIRPEELQLSLALVEAVANWRCVWGSIELLWLDSGHYEAWALAELANLDSAANQRGRAVVEQLSAVNPCYFQCFEDQSAEEWQPLQVCPSCEDPLTSYAPGSFAYCLCDQCGLLFWAERD